LTVLRLVIKIFAHVARRCVSAKVFCWDTGDFAIASPTILPRHSITKCDVTSADEHYQQEHMERNRHFSNTPRATSAATWTLVTDQARPHVHQNTGTKERRVLTKHGFDFGAHDVCKSVFHVIDTFHLPRQRPCNFMKKKIEKNKTFLVFDPGVCEAHKFLTL
jgi:hypothetical protein